MGILLFIVALFALASDHPGIAFFAVLAMVMAA